MTEPNAAEQPETAKQSNVDGDFLGYGVYADTLWTRIEKSLKKDADGKTKLGDDPLVVGIFGEWGAGKSKLLSMVLQRAQQQSLRDIALRMENATKGKPITVTVPVFFQPWKYEHESHLHVPLAVHIADALQQAWKTMPTDMEVVKVWAAKSGEFSKEAIEKIDKAKGVFEAAKNYWNGAKAFVQSDAAKVAAGVTDIALASVLSPPFVSIAREGIIKALGDGEGEFWDKDEDEDGDEDSAASAAPNKKKASAAAQTAKPKPNDAHAHTSDGLGFYRLHQRLQALTRPKKNQKLLNSLGIKTTQGIEFELHINFVVLIDDLDRCLPEKAVEALELIKTVFNLESFAFVLALDEEVVERGIGHRYRDYNFEGKKPEMPITGFEYLEKIVHLPFRLPALTEPQAVQFVRRYEAGIENDANKRWFDAPWQPQIEANKDDMQRAMRGQSGFGYDLLPLALQSFDAYVPRKLIRMVELMHQTAAVADKRRNPLSRHPTAGSSTDEAAALDTRVVLALVMAQLFQPELYRIMRRRAQAFPFLLAVFADRGKGVRDFPTADMSDIDLWDWVATPAQDAADSPYERTAPAIDIAIKRIGMAYKADHAQRAYAQHTRLPIVAQLVEHRSAQRHVFDALKLMQALAYSLEDTAIHAGQFGDKAPSQASPAANLVFKPYRSLLSQTDLPRQPSTITATIDAKLPALTTSMAVTADSVQSYKAYGAIEDKRPSYTVRDIDKLLSDLLSTQTELQANLADNNDLPQGHVLAAASAKALLQKLKTALDQDGGLMQQMVSGLPYLAPYLSRQDGPMFWDLVVKHMQGNDQLGQPIADDAALAPRERWADLRSTLGADPRFDIKKWHLPIDEQSKNEPIPGFVHVAYDPHFKLTDASGQDTVDKAPFYLARTLTTVDQYAAFMADGGYSENAPWWDSQGNAWRNMQWASETNEPNLRKWLDERTQAQRQQPMRWAEQQAHGSRAVCGVNWFEARAYSRWLDAKLRTAIAALPGGNYSAGLPTEAQWERAARAATAGKQGLADGREYPWEASAKQAQQAVHLRANINGSKIGRASVVGLFPPNILQASDLAGNVWEWQDGLYEAKGKYSAWRRIDRIKELAAGGKVGADWLETEENWQKSALPALRGGSWFSTAGDARCSVRDRYRPVNWNDSVGFRVVLSLA